MERAGPRGTWMREAADGCSLTLLPYLRHQALIRGISVNQRKFLLILRSFPGLAVA